MRCTFMPVIVGFTSILFLYCDTGTNSQLPTQISGTYNGAVRDSVMVTKLPANFGYDSTRFTYILREDSTYEVHVAITPAMGKQRVETGTWSQSDFVFTFRPLENFSSNAVTHLMQPADTLRPVHTGHISRSGFTIADFLNIGNKSSARNLGAVIFVKQQP